MRTPAVGVTPKLDVLVVPCPMTVHPDVVPVSNPPLTICPCAAIGATSAHRADTQPSLLDIRFSRKARERSAIPCAAGYPQRRETQQESDYFGTAVWVGPNPA